MNIRIIITIIEVLLLSFIGYSYNVKDNNIVNYEAKKISESSVAIEKIKKDLIDYLFVKVPEIKILSKQIESNSQGRAHLVVYIESVPIKSNINNPYNDEYYYVYVGESNKDHKVRWNTFKIHEKTKDILCFYINEERYIPLDRWRKLYNEKK